MIFLRNSAFQETSELARVDPSVSQSRPMESRIRWSLFGGFSGAEFSELGGFSKNLPVVKKKPPGVKKKPPGG